MPVPDDASSFMSEQPIYLDHQATTPVDPRVLEVMIPYFTKVFGNAASKDHVFGLEAKRAVEKARKRIASAINARPDEIIFTSGATESDNIAIFGVAEKLAHKGDHLITCVTEHRAVLDCCQKLEKCGKKVTYLPVDQYGRVDPDDVRKAITPKTILISIMAANNEIGTLAPLTEIGQIATEYGVLFHTDAAQALGHIPLDVKAMNTHIMSLSAHKVYGPKGIGVLYCRRSNPRAQIAPIIYGGGHERGLRPGTLNIVAIVGFGIAARIAIREMKQENTRYRHWTQKMFEHLQEGLGDIHLNGHPVDRLAHNLNVSIPGVESRALIVKLKNLAIATGSACTSEKVEPSHVIKALGFGEQRAYSAIRISVGRTNNEEQIKSATDQIKSVAKKISLRY